MDGTLQSSSPGDTVDEADILWNGGPVVGMALYQAQAYYIWGLDVNVVEVAIGESNVYDAGAPYQHGGAGSAIIAAHSPLSENAMEATISVTVTGPTVGASERGKKFLQLGLSHQTRYDAKHALYNDTTPPQQVRGSLEDGLIHWDVFSQNTIPWTKLDANHYLDIISDAQVVQDHEFWTGDNPNLYTTDRFVLNGDQADVLALVLQHWVPLVVRTKDTRVIDPNDVRTERAMLEWSFDGTGTVDAAGVWTLNSPPGLSIGSFSEISDGTRLPDAAANIMDAADTETWIVEDQ